MTFGETIFADPFDATWMRWRVIMARRDFFSSYFAVRSYFSLFGTILFKLINGLGIFFSSFLTERQTKFFPYSFKCFYNCVIK